MWLVFKRNVWLNINSLSERAKIGFFFELQKYPDIREKTRELRKFK